MAANRICNGILLAICAMALTACSGNRKTDTSEQYLILISLDGFRWDYVDTYQPPNLSKFIKNGVQAESLIPCFPTKTFPNHYSIATGMYPDNHGLLSNKFYSYEKKKLYSIGDRETVEDGTFYGGTPIWVQAHKAGLVTASYFFVGSEADVQGIRPDYFYRYDGSVPNEDRVSQVLEWLKMPQAKRPRLITTYFSSMDDVGHRFGPNNKSELRSSLMQLDMVLGSLFDGIEKSGLPVNVMIVSDHGMLEVPIDKYIPVELVKNDALYRTVNNGAMVSIYPKDEGETDNIYNYLQFLEENFEAYKTEDVPQFEVIPTSKNWGPIQVVPHDGHYFGNLRAINIGKKTPGKVSGQHGFDPEMKEMHGVFYANGPAFKSGYEIPSIKNIHLYPLMCEVLRISPPPGIDGELSQARDALDRAR